MCDVHLLKIIQVSQHVCNGLMSKFYKSSGVVTENTGRCQLSIRMGTGVHW